MPFSGFGSEPQSMAVEKERRKMKGEKEDERRKAEGGREKEKRERRGGRERIRRTG